MKRIIVLLLIVLSSSLFADGTNDINKYLEIINNEPGNFRAYNKIGLLYTEKEDYIQAEKYFKNAIILNNNYYEGYFNLGLLYYDHNKLEEALDHFKRAYILNKDQVDLYVCLINTCLKLNKITQAKEYFNKGSTKFKETSYKLLNCGGVIELLYKNHKKAKEYFEKALKMKDDNKMKNNLAIAEYKLGNKKEALDILKDIDKSINVISENYKLVK